MLLQHCNARPASQIQQLSGLIKQVNEMSSAAPTQNIAMDAGQLCREEVYTDSQVGTIRRLVPVTTSGADDPAREVLWFGSTQILTPAGALPLNFEIPAASLAEAVAGFGEAAREAVDRTMDELRELQRQAASQIVVPKGGMGPGSFGGMGGGKIQLP